MTQQQHHFTLYRHSWSIRLRGESGKVVKSRKEKMEEAKGVVKHILVAKFRDDVTPQRIEELIKGYANLVNLVPSMKAFQWYITPFPSLSL